MPIKIDHKKDLLKEYKKFKLFFYVYKPADLKKIFNKKNSEVQNILMTNKKKNYGVKAIIIITTLRKHLN